MEETSKQTADFYNVIKERRSVRYYDPSVKIPEGEMLAILEEATLAPSGNNLQPWRFLVVNDPEQKQKLLPIAFNQQQVVDASAVIVVLGDKNAFEESNRDDICQKAVEAGYMSEETKNGMLKMMKGFYGAASEQSLKESLLIDASLASMQLMLVAKARGYDTVPMLGFNAEELRKTFKIPDHLIIALMLPIGKAAQPGHPTIRLNAKEVTYFNTIS